MRYTIPQVLLMDLCGTILDTGNLDRAIMDVIGRKYTGEPYSVLRARKIGTRSMRSNFSNFFGISATAAYRDYVTELVAAMRSVKLFPGVKEFLSTAEKYGLKVGIITNRPRVYLDEAMVMFELHRYVSGKWSAIDDFGIEKPAREVVDSALQQLSIDGIERRHVGIVGDSSVDVLLAMNSNCRCFIYTAANSVHESQLLKSMSISGHRFYQFSTYDGLTRYLFTREVFNAGM